MKLSGLLVALAVLLGTSCGGESPGSSACAGELRCYSGACCPASLPYECLADERAHGWSDQDAPHGTCVADPWTCWPQSAAKCVGADAP